jgi:trimeric autotransporter adhesin
VVTGVAGGGALYTVLVTGMTGTGTVAASILAGAATDVEGDPSLASTSTDNSVIFDNVAPTVTINQRGAQADPTNGSPILFDVVFSESVTGFDASDISLAGSTAGGTLVPFVTGSGATYTVSVSGMTSSGAVVASVVAGAAPDLAGNVGLASTSTDNTVSFVEPQPTSDDFNGDGNSDVLWRQDGSGQVYVWEMNGRQVQAEGAVAHAPVTSDWHVFSDLNFI